MSYPDRDPQLFYELAKARLETQLAIVDALDNKLGLLISLGSALGGVLVAVLAIRGGSRFGGGEWVMIGLSGLSYLVAAAVTAFAYFARDWCTGPDLKAVWDLLHEPLTDDEIKWYVAATFWADYRDNRPAQTTKENVLPVALVAVVVQTVSLAVALVLVAAGA
jgi:hypothetical protein